MEIDIIPGRKQRFGAQSRASPTELSGDPRALQGPSTATPLDTLAPSQRDMSGAGGTSSGSDFNSLSGAHPLMDTTPVRVQQSAAARRAASLPLPVDFPDLFGGLEGQ